MDYGFHIKQLNKKIEQLELIVEEAIRMLDVKDARIGELEKENKKLLQLVSQGGTKEVKKTSRNSNLPPSMDLNKTKSKHPKSKKSSGGQPGHKGHTLEMVANPNKVIPSIPKVCFKCGKALMDADKVLNDSKQIIDVPPVQRHVTQFDSYKIVCNCGGCNLGGFPDHVEAKVQYGPGVRSWISYLSTYQFVSYPRIKELLKVAFNINISQGTIFNAIKRTATKAEGLYQLIQNFITQSDVVGADETVIRVKGDKHYIWVWQNDKATFIVASNNRSKENIYKYFPAGFPFATLVSDRYKAHLSTPAAHHQICWAHLIRLCIFLKDTEDNPWVHKLLDLYRRAKHLEKLKTSRNKNGKKVQQLEADFNQLLLEPIDKTKFEHTAKLQNSLIKHRQAVFTFVYHPKVPSHNNASEIAIRNFKVKMKVSGQFKSAQNYFAVIRSLIDTLTKNKKPVFDSLFKLETNQDVPLGFVQFNT